MNSGDAANERALKLWVVLARAHAAVQRIAHEDIERHGLSPGAFAVLEALYHKGPMLLGEVQRKVLVSSGGITYLVDRLEKVGLVERKPCQHDRRAMYAALTPSGEELIGRIFAGHADVIGKALSGLTQDEQRAATDLLRRLGLHAARVAGVEPG